MVSTPQPRPWRGLARVGTIGLVVLMGAMCLAYYQLLASFMVQRLNMNDFGKFYYSAQLFLAGEDMYGPSPATQIPVSDTESRQFLNMNPPHFHLLMLPLAVLTPVQALMLWVAVSLLALWASSRAIARELGIVWTPARVFWVVAAVICCSITGTIVVTGQLTFLLLLPVTLAWIAVRRGDWTRAAALLGACASVKPFLGIFLVYLVLRRDFRSAAVMCLAGVAWGALGLVVFGWSAYESWLAALSSVEWTWAAMNGSLAAIVSRALAESPYYAPLVNAPWLVPPVTLTLALVVGVVSLRRLARCVPKSADHVFGGVLLTAQLVSPLGWIYYLPLVAGPAVALYQSSRVRISRVRDGLALIALPGLLVPYVFMMVWSAAPWIGMTLGSLYAWTTLCLWGSVMVDCRVLSNAVFVHSPAVAEAAESPVSDSRRLTLA